MILNIEKTTKILKALADQNRLNIVMAIGNGTHSVTEIINATELSQTLVSFHLKTLRNSAIVTTERDGPFIYYSLSDPGLVGILNDLSRTADSLELDAGGISVSSHARGPAGQRK